MHFINKILKKISIEEYALFFFCFIRVLALYYGIYDFFLFFLGGTYHIYYMWLKRKPVYSSFFWPVPGFPEKGVGYIPIFCWYITVFKEEEWEEFKQTYPPEEVFFQLVNLFYTDGHIRPWVWAQLGHTIVWSTDLLSYMEGRYLPPIMHVPCLGGDLYIKLYTGTLKQGISFRFRL